jgi:hypothetical protein
MYSWDCQQELQKPSKKRRCPVTLPLGCLNPLLMLKKTDSSQRGVRRLPAFTSHFSSLPVPNNCRTMTQQHWAGRLSPSPSFYPPPPLMGLHFRTAPLASHMRALSSINNAWWLKNQIYWRLENLLPVIYWGSCGTVQWGTSAFHRRNLDGGLTGHVACMGDEKLSLNLKGKDRLWDLRANGRILLRWILNE